MFLRGLFLIAATLSMLACSEDYSSDRGPFSAGFYMIPESRADDGNGFRLLAVELNRPEMLTFTTERNDDSYWVITSHEDGYYQISNNVSGIQDGLLALGVVNDGVFDRLAMTEISGYSGQKWKFTHLENGYCRLTTELLGPEMALTVVDDGESAQLSMASVSTDSAQHWRLDSFSGRGVLIDRLVEGCDDDLSRPFDQNASLR